MNWSPEQETVTVQTTHFGLLMSVRCENINRLLIILKYQLMKYLYYTKKHAFEVLFIEVRSYALHRRNCWSVLQSKTCLKLGLTWDVTNFLSDILNPGETMVSQYPFSLWNFKILHSIVRPAQQGRIPQNFTAVPPEYKSFPLACPGTGTFARTYPRSPHSLFPE